MSLLIKIEFASNGEGTISFNNKSYPCLGQKERNYPKDITILPSDKKLRHYSQEFKVWLDYAILIWGQVGIYIHWGADNITDNGGAGSAGCIHVEKPQIKELYNWITERTRIIIDHPWDKSL
jgi:lipoprotein-anchoring transpeptidase ErfK/SrfK